MKEKEFNLSKFMWSDTNEKILKEAVKRETKLIVQFMKNEIDYAEFKLKRYKLFGDKLI